MMMMMIIIIIIREHYSGIDVIPGDLQLQICA
jgi:hypothetical protein